MFRGDCRKTARELLEHPWLTSRSSVEGVAEAKQIYYALRAAQEKARADEEEEEEEEAYSSSSSGSEDDEADEDEGEDTE